MATTTTTTTTDPFAIAVRAALRAIKTERAAGRFGNAGVYHAIATSGISVQDAAAVSGPAVEMAFEIYNEGRI